MKNFKILFISTVFATLMFAGCSEDYLDREPLDKVSDAAVFENVGYMEALLFEAYAYMPNGWTSRSTGGHKGRGLGAAAMLDCNTDILVAKSGWVESWDMVNQGQFADDFQGFGNYNVNYRAIYRCNLLLDGIENSTLKDDSEVQLIKAETRFLRAFYYFDLVRRHGAVPFYTSVPDVDNKDELFLPRTPASDIYDFVYSEFNAVADVLPLAKDMKDADWGRACREAAWALNGRAMLFAERYSESAALSKKVLDAIANGTSDRKLASDYYELSISSGGDPEVLFEVLFDGVNKGGTVDEIASPPQFAASWGGMWNPTEDLVRSYEMADGKPATTANGYDPQDPYTNRDPRLDMTVIRHGTEFYGITFDLSWLWDENRGRWGYDRDEVSDNAPHNTGFSTITGYYLRKFMNPATPKGAFGYSTQSWKVIRLAEVYLNYAEAENEANGPSQDVFDAINAVRNRVGMPNIEDTYSVGSKEEVFERIQHERKVELCFEGHRFWDIRRWGIGEEIMNGSTDKDGNPQQGGGYMACCYVLDQEDGTYLYLTPETKADVEALISPNTKLRRSLRTRRDEFKWHEKNYLMPIPQDAIEANSKLTQNPGY